MSYFGNKDLRLEIPRGTIPELSSINKFGRNPSIGTNSTETIWDGSSLYSFASTADITHLRQAVDQVAMRGEKVEIQGLDASWGLTLQNVILDATDSTTPVALTTALKRVFRMKALSAITADQDIEVRNVGGGTTYASMLAGHNQTLMAVYTVPAGVTAYMTQYYFDMNKVGGGGDPDINGKLWARDNANNYAPQIKHVLGAKDTATSHISHSFNPYVRFGEKTDLYINVENLSSTASADVVAGFDLILDQN